jgi:hypothetical protein
MSVEVEKAGIRRQLRAYEMAFVRLRSSLEPGDAAVVFEEALEGCLLEEDRPDFGPMPTPSGPVTMLEESDRPEVWQWLDRVAARLSAAGVTGSLGAAASAKPPVVIPQGRVPTAGIVFTSLEQPWQGADVWPLTTSETRTLVDHAARWCDLGGEQWLGLNLQFWLRGGSTGELVEPMRAAATSAITDLNAVRGAEERGVRTSWASWGVQVVHSVLGWQEQVDLCRQALLWEPDLVSWGVVGTANFPALLSVTNLCPPALRPRDRLEAFGLRGTLVNAVQGIQLLTGTHLARAHDLSDWDVTQVSSDRFLVEAQDLAPWFTGERTDPDVYDKAAADFGPMILSPETAEEFGIQRGR